MESRRTFIKHIGIAGALPIAAPALLSGRASADVNAELAALDPFAPLDRANYTRLRNTFRDPKDGGNLVRRLWETYAETGEFRYGHWAVLYTQLWWQSLPVGKERLKVSKIAVSLANRLRSDAPDHAAGPFWGAVHLGFEALVRGVLDSLNMIPKFFELLDEAEARDPEYLEGSVYLAKAKAYLKLPSFPMSVGSMKKGYQYLQKAEPYQETTYGLWHIVRAEGEMMRSGKDAAFAALEGLDKVCPTNVQLQYTYEISNWFAGKFKTAVEAGSYNKYTWDPMLESILPLANQPPTYADC